MEEAEEKIAKLLQELATKEKNIKDLNEHSSKYEIEKQRRNIDGQWEKQNCGDIWDDTYCKSGVKEK